jgi:hypothetical protein
MPSTADTMVSPSCRGSVRLMRRLDRGIGLFEQGVAPLLLLSGGGAGRCRKRKSSRASRLDRGVPGQHCWSRPDRATPSGTRETAQLLRARGRRWVLLVSDRAPAAGRSAVPPRRVADRGLGRGADRLRCGGSSGRHCANARRCREPGAGAHSPLAALITAGFRSTPAQKAKPKRECATTAVRRRAWRRRSKEQRDADAGSDQSIVAADETTIAAFHHVVRRDRLRAATARARRKSA